MFYPLDSAHIFHVAKAGLDIRAGNTQQYPINFAADAKLTLNGRQIQRGADFRYGHRKTTKGKDLTVWIKTETSRPIKVKIERAG